MQNTQPKPVPPPEFETERIDKLTATELAALLAGKEASEFEKAKACQRLAQVGGRDAVPALAGLLTDAKLSHYARYGLEPIPDRSADTALRAALPKVQGDVLIGVINSIGFRRDAEAVAPLSKLMLASDMDVARAAASAIGHISGQAAAKVLTDGLSKTRGPVRTAVADACLVCAERLLAAGQRDSALALYNVLTARDIPKPMRLAAMHNIIAAETSLSRPRQAPTAAP
jgi:HEAT repeat protein